MPLLFLLLLLLPLLGTAQTLHRRGCWSRFCGRAQRALRLALYSEFDGRRLAFLGGQWQFITYQHLPYRWSSPWEAVLGSTLSWQPQNSAPAPEQRVFEEATATLPLAGSHLRRRPRLRVEQRWLGQLAGPDRTGTWRYRIRCRARVQLDYHLGTGWKLRAFDEVFLSADSFDQNRVFAGAERRLSRSNGLPAPLPAADRQRGLLRARRAAPDGSQRPVAAAQRRVATLPLVNYSLFIVDYL